MIFRGRGGGLGGFAFASLNEKKRQQPQHRVITFHHEGLTGGRGLVDKKVNGAGARA